jgi:hypothetical protein
VTGFTELKKGGGFGHSAATGEAAQFFQLIEQIEGQGATGQVDAKILLEPDRGPHPFDRQSGKMPFPCGRSLWGDDALFDHLMDHLGTDTAQPAEISKVATGFFVQNHALDVDSLFGHLSDPQFGTRVERHFFRQGPVETALLLGLRLGEDDLQGDDLVAVLAGGT